MHVAMCSYVAAMQQQRICNKNDYLSVQIGYAACTLVIKDKKTVAYLPAGIKLHLSV